MDLLAPMRTFVRVVETGSFTAVAREASTSQPTISRQIAALEAHLGARLLTRSTRALTPTQDGRAFYEHARRALEAVGEAENAVGRRRGRPSGTLKLSIPVVFGRLHVVPRLGRFLARYPELSIELAMGDGFADLVEQGIDLAIRVGVVQDQGLVARRIGTVRRLAVAAPSYLRRRGAPDSPAALASHDCIAYTRLATGNRWHFQGRDGPIAVDITGRFATDSSEGVREAVRVGLGVALIPAFAISDEVRRGRVRVLLRDYEPTPLPLSLVYPSRRLVPLKVRAMADFLAREFAPDGPGKAPPTESGG